MQTKEEIIKEFNKNFHQKDGPEWSYLPNDQIANWWISKLSQQKQEIIEMAEGMKVPKNKYPEDFTEGNALIWESLDGYNQALEEVISAVKKYA